MYVSKLYKSFQGKVALNNLDITFSEGVVHGLLGANGAGKSTLIKILMGLVFPTQGEVGELENISLLPENPCIPENLSAYQIVQFACRVQKEGDIESLLTEVRLKKEAWTKPVRTYSKGMKQRAAIAVALAGQPKWLVLDEPMSGLDAMGRKQMLDLFEKRKACGTNILMCSHAVTDLVRLCNQVHIMAEGKYCETFNIEKHSMAEVEILESRLVYWSGKHVAD